MPVAVASRHHHSGANHSGPTLTHAGDRKKSKVKHYGIEVVKGVTWRGWEPGREYTKNVILKNVHVKTQKLKYRYVNLNPG